SVTVAVTEQGDLKYSRCKTPDLLVLTWSHVNILSVDFEARRRHAKTDLINWIGAFGEGFAMLAAAGGPDIHPHEYSKPEDRARWDRDIAKFNDDLKKVQQFFLDILSNKLSEEERTKTGFSFFGVQGPWYTVGWK